MIGNLLRSRSFRILSGIQSKSYQSLDAPDSVQDLGRLPPPQRLAAISAALPFASDIERASLASLLVRMALPPRAPTPGPFWLGRLSWRLVGPALTAIHAQRTQQSDAATIELARLWCLLPPLAHPAALEACHGRWKPAVRAAAADPSPQFRLGAAQVVVATGDPALLAELRPLLADPDATVAATVESAFIATAKSAIAESTVRLEAERQIAAALGEFDTHRRRGILGAAIAMMSGPRLYPSRPEGRGPLATLLRDDSQVFQMALRSFIRRSDDPAIRGQAWIWLGHALSPTAVRERLSRASSPQDHESVLRRIHLIENPRRAREARMIRPAAAPTAPIPDAPTLPHLSAAARRGLPRWLTAIDSSIEDRTRLATLLLADPDPSVRLAVMAVAPTRALTQACLDADGRIAASALRRSSTAGVERRRIPGRAERPAAPIKHPTDHASEPVRILARQERERLDPWESRSPASRLAARAWLASDPIAFDREVREQLASAEGCLPAALVIRALNLSARFENELLALLHAAPAGATDDRLTPTILAALGEVGSAAARAAVDAHLRNDQPRARANAVEALTRQVRTAAPGDRRADVLIELKNDPHHRVRANAIRGLFGRGSLFGESAVRLEEPIAFDALGAMLSDSRPAHRVAAIWLAGRVLASASSAGRRSADLAGRLTDLARTDSDATARARAFAASSRLILGVREGWKVSAADTGLGAGRAA